METAHHMVVECRFTKKLWEQVANWVAREELRPTNWPHSETVMGWWTSITTSLGVPPKEMRKPFLLIGRFRKSIIRESLGSKGEFSQ